jgi:putative FmdB family regulatory protein
MNLEYAMPIYEYLCDQCGTEFEKFLRSSEAAAGIACPSCGEPRVTQRVSTFAAHAHGSSEDGMPSCPSGMCATPDLCGRN